MTALNAFVRGREAHILTDAAYLDTQGRLIFIGSKVRMLPHLNAVCVIRGESELDGAFTAMFGTAFTSFDALAKDFRTAIDNVLSSHDKGRPYAPVDVVVAGVSEFSRKPELWTASRGTPPEPVRYSRDRAYISPALGDAAAATLEAQDLDPFSDEFDPVMDGADLLEAQRVQVIQPAGFPPCHIVGGFVQLTTISADGISTRVLRRWPDQVGQRIKP